jgi:Amt family ammonium transporter
MALYAFAATFVCWCLWAFRMSFGDRLLPFVGRPDLAALNQAFLTEQGFAGAYPAATLLFFQFVFAAITLILVAGSLLGRMNFRAWMLFVPLWLTFSYTIGAFSLWSPNGFLFKAGVMDFAGGYVIHLSSGIAGFTASYWVRTLLHAMDMHELAAFVAIINGFGRSVRGRRRTGRRSRRTTSS